MNFLIQNVVLADMEVLVTKKSKMIGNEEFEYISVSEYAEREGVSSQTIRNRIKDNLIETVTFKRGKLNGILCKIKKN